MNCVKGDLARIVGTGYIVRCVEPFNGPWGGPEFGCDAFMDAGWRLDRELPHLSGDRSDVRRDIWLRPIRDQPGEDEMLRIVGKPEPVSA